MPLTRLGGLFTTTFSAVEGLVQSEPTDTATEASLNTAAPVPPDEYDQPMRRKRVPVVGFHATTGVPTDATAAAKGRKMVGVRCAASMKSRSSTLTTGWGFAVLMTLRVAWVMGISPQRRVAGGGARDELGGCGGGAEEVREG